MKEDAVSPVIGVMLMLVVTLVIAAAVSAFAGGLAGDTKSAPQASFDLEVDLQNNLTIFEHRGGDPVDLDEIAVVFEQENSKITLKRTDTGTDCIAFEKVGDTGTIVRPGDCFEVVGEPSTWGTGITYGQMSILDNREFRWSIIHLPSSTVLSTGTGYIG